MKLVVVLLAPIILPVVTTTTTTATATTTQTRDVIRADGGDATSLGSDIVGDGGDGGGRRDRSLSSDDYARGANIRPYALPWWHPEIQYVAVNRIPGPSNHPLLDDDPEFQAFVRANTDEGHRFFDGNRGYIRRPDGLPRGHPNCDNYFVYEELPVADLPSVQWDHPDVHEAYSEKKDLPRGHPSVSGLLRKVLPAGHPDVDDLFLDHEELPSWHPDLSLLLVDDPIEPIRVFGGHPDIGDNLGKPVDDHPSVHRLFEANLPDGHPDLDGVMREGFVLPSWHPDIGEIVVPRSSATSPGWLLVFVVSALLAAIVLARSVAKWRNSARTREVAVHRNAVVSEGGTTSDSSSVDLSETRDGNLEATRRVHRRDDNDDAILDSADNQERILVFEEKTSSWKKAFGKRVTTGEGDRSVGEAALCLCYLLINAAALLASPSYGLGPGFGSLSAGNTLFVFLAAARNGVFAWFVGVAFDRALVYHRFFGRLAVLLALVHSCFYIDDVVARTTDRVAATGLITLGCGLVIVLSSLNCFRRKYFNFFFWTHHAFAGFVVGLFLHAPAARPFVAASVLCYSLDKVVQLTRKMPRTTSVFEKVDDRTVLVQFAKGRLSACLGRHDVGQYVFVNFPSLSLQEWHPFSVASGPSDPHVDIYIRALGDHTKKIVQYAERCAEENKQVKIRSDGPYGTLPFNYRRYGSIVFAAGGIGITPIISILKDIYGGNNGTAGSRKKKHHPHHCISHVSVVWIMPHASESSLFLDLLNSFHLKSLEDPLLPEFKVSIHATRDSAQDAMIPGQEIVFSKPDFKVIMNEHVEDMQEDLRSVLVYACGPGGMVNQLWDASSKKNSKKLRVDFYHETFEF